MTNKRSKVLTFFISLIPGAGEMFLGFYKMGASIMIIFWGIVAFSNILFPPLFYLLPILWFYSFFHTIEEILQIVKGPDFPTGGMILGTRGIEEAYRTGRGKIRVRAITDIETMPNGKSRIIVTELPFMVNKARLIEKMAELVRDKKIDGITDLSDQSNRVFQIKT